MSKELFRNDIPVRPSAPTNRQAAKRPYCQKHARAMLDIGGEKKCPTCREEERKAGKP